MWIVIDIVLLAVFVTLMVVFTKNGFAKTVYSLGKTWLSLFCSLVMGPFVSAKLQDWFLRAYVTNGINNTLTNAVTNNPNGYSLEQLFNNLPEGFVNFLAKYDISYTSLAAEYGYSAQANEQILADISRKAAEPFSALIATLIGHVVCFVFTFLFFKWLINKIKARKYPFLRYVDHISGFVVGTALGYCAVWGICTVLYMIFEIIIAFDASNPVMSVYSSSYIFKFVNEFDMFGAMKQLWQTIVH